MIKAIAFRDMRYNNEPLSAAMGRKVHYDDNLFEPPVVTHVGDHYEIIDGKWRIDRMLELGFGGCACDVIYVQRSNIQAVREQLNERAVSCG